jgi:hypothetical protein
MSLQLQSYVPYLIDPGLAPRAASLPELRRFDPFSVTSAPFIGKLRDLDEAAYGPRALAAPAWVFYDCGLVPGATLGFGNESAEGFTPASLLVALPTAAPDMLLVHTLALAPETPTDVAPALWQATWKLALDMLAPRGLLVTETWSASAMHQLAALGPSRVLVAHHPAHDHPMTATLGIDPRFGAHTLDANHVASDIAAFAALQRRINDGCSCWYLGVSADGAHTFHVADHAPSPLQDHAFATRVAPC